MPINIDIVDKAISIVAKRNSGKSYLLRYLVKKQAHKFKKIFVICPTDSINSFYITITDKSCIFNEFNENWANQLIDQLMQVNSDNNQDKKRVLLILDDCMTDINFCKSKAMKTIYSRGRHFFLTIISASQYLKNLSPLCRSNSDFVFCGQSNRASIDILIHEFCCNLSNNEFIDLYKKAIINYGFLVINNNSIKDNDNINNMYGRICTPKEFL